MLLKQDGVFAEAAGLEELDGAYRTTPEGGPLTLVADVPLGDPNAAYTRLGDVVGWLTLAGWIGFMVLQSVMARRHTEAGAAVPTSI